MRYEIIIHNQHASQPLIFIAVADAIEAAPAPITPNIPAGGLGAARVRVKSVPVNPVTPNVGNGGHPGGTIYYSRTEATVLRYYKISIFPPVAGGFVAVQRCSPTGVVPNPQTGNYQAYGTVFMPTGPKLAVSKFVHAGVVRLSLTI
ncbi:hypothetical protein IY145_19650 [Methylosinus sp. H3A]|uniref:hypothetical protein n=1 Tax=Methylosinus sp. H3A TaxID=2785786 RepID=UPI0018C251C4|nr:hypothetical protein [Methylosinus sp. H3A]MBG0811568.1 hypothetical protein [Methylosinus sp. H3A]